MKSENYFTDDHDLVMIFEHLIPWKDVVLSVEGAEFEDHRRFLETGKERFSMAPSNEKEAVELYRSALDSLGEFFGYEVSPFSALFDREGLSYENGKVIFPEELVSVYEKFRNSGLMPYAIPRSSGGLGFPAVLSAFYAMIMSRGDVSFSMTVNLLNLAQIVSRFGTEEQSEKYVIPASAGDTLFAMSLTEPDYGSDLNSVRMSAVRQEDGSYILNGTKRFISQGCGLGQYPALLLTLARTEKSSSGARGLSLFLVKSTDVQIAGIEKKMGIHASPTCELVYENCRGELLGEEGFGLTRYTLGMTNFMRLGSASGGAGGGAAGYFESEKYCGERIQFGKPIGKIPAVAEMLNRLKRETNAMRLLALEAAYSVDMYQHEQIRMEKKGVSDRDIRKNEKIRTWSGIASILTPIAKYYGSEQGQACASTAVQIHGGVGYTEDFDVSRLFRDARINTIYEGTSQIQVRISSGAFLAGMSEEGGFRKYMNSLKKDIIYFKEMISEQSDLMESCISAYRKITDEEKKERRAEDLINAASRHICSVLYARATEKLNEKGLAEDWKNDFRNYALDSTALMKGAEYRILRN
ncbi:MAG TPA: acyl-CoA dehydrogenase family protein [Leptospiraceae bacterium]|nr:acyl-CoA dehydrogenase family protein [Leptospiraceae bacterium]HNF26984.1 acyl-CoA dehydrogenase family protein [Leptospiraceae bacterium]HNI98558.1 acyl-CoA dehydrogenase family protein [Leptospiraceae bacterium]HNM03332.1 acyl-CoA dehydrogenase family protein [Leptospiraceae bacterium]